MKKLITATLVLMLSSVAALAADFTGKWTAEVPSRQGGTMTNTFNLKQDGEKLTGSMSTQMGDAEISNGKVEGDNISFDVVRTFNDNKVTLSYAGKADGADSIKFTRTIKMAGGDDQGPPPQEFTAKKAAGN
jgi:predicted regulator of Ras-like GTPase activity (Roadblock/LC7/MglB family)